MYDPQLEKLVDMALEDGVITEKEKDILVKRAKSLGIDLDEFEMYLDSRLASLSNTQNTTSNQNKFGNLLKCPSCGASVPSLSMTCKDCGFAFRNISANSSVKELSNKLEHVSRTVVNEKKGWIYTSKWLKIDDIKSEIVRNFPIPNTKDDLMEFAIFISQNMIPIRIFASLFSPIEAAAQQKTNFFWIEKYKQLILKAKILCKDDPSFAESLINLAKKRQIKMHYSISVFLFYLGLYLSLMSSAINANRPIFPIASAIVCFLYYASQNRLVNWDE